MATATTWAPTPNWPVSYPVFNYNPLPYAPPLQQSVPMLPPPQYSQTWSRSSTPLSCDTTNLPPPPKLEPGQIPERAIDAPSGSRVNIINAISGGSNEPVLETKRQCKEYFRTVSHVSEGNASEQLGRMSRYPSHRQTFGCNTTHTMTLSSLGPTSARIQCTSQGTM